MIHCNVVICTLKVFLNNCNFNHWFFINYASVLTHLFIIAWYELFSEVLKLCGEVKFTYCQSCLWKLIRKDGDYHSSRMLDTKDLRANQNMQPKKKHKKSGSSNKVKEKVEVRAVSELHFSMETFRSDSTNFVLVVSIYFPQWTWMMTAHWKSRRTSSVTTAMELSGAATT